MPVCHCISCKGSLARRDWLAAGPDAGVRRGRRSDGEGTYKSQLVPKIDIKSNTITEQDGRSEEHLHRIQSRKLRDQLSISFLSSFAKRVCARMCIAKEKLVTKSGNGNVKSESAKNNNWTTLFTKVIIGFAF